MPAVSSATCIVSLASLPIPRNYVILYSSNDIWGRGIKNVSDNMIWDGNLINADTNLLYRIVNLEGILELII